MNDPYPIAAYIEAHRATVLVDEASFDDKGRPIDAILAERIGAVEHAAFIEFVAAPCRSPEDVQAKLAYLLTGTVGELDCLAIYGDDIGERFLRSLLVEDAPRAEHAYAGMCAREVA